jgi:hypothetical protein
MFEYIHLSLGLVHKIMSTWCYSKHNYVTKICFNYFSGKPLLTIDYACGYKPE